MKVQEALKKLIEYVESTASFIPTEYDHIGIDVVNAGKSALSDIDECEPVGEVQFMPELNDSWIGSLPVGTKLYTSPQPIEKCVPVYLVNELDLGWEEVNRIYYDAVIDCPKRILYTSPISKEREGWVSVDDRLPEENTRVLLCDNSSVEFGYLSEHGIWYGEGYGYDGAYDIAEGVTHWQYLPAAPDKE